MAPRTPIIAGKSVIVVQVQDLVDSGFKTIESKLFKFSNRISKLGFELFSGGLLGSLGTTALVKEFQKFEDELLFLFTKIRPTDVQFQALTETIKKLGRETSFTTIEVAKTATVLAQAGFGVAEVQKLLLPTLDLARGAQIELAAAGEVLANTLRSFSIEAGRAGEVASQFVAASRLGTLDVLNLKESIKEVLGTARTLNIDLPTTLALITQLAERSLKGTKAGTSLNTALLNLASKGKQLQNLGIILPDNINGDSFIEFLKVLYERINRLGNLKRVAVLQQLFNIRGARAITALDDIKKVIDLQTQIREAGDEARQASLKMDSEFGGAVRRATSALESLGLKLGEIVAKGIQPMLSFIPPLSALFERLAVVNKELAFSLLVTPPILLGLGAGLLVTAFATAKFAGFIGILGAAIKSTSDLIGRALIEKLKLIAIGFDRIKRSAKAVDTGVAAALLPRVLTGGRGRNARKPKATSFIGRVGNAATSFTQIGKITTAPILSASRIIGNLTKLVVNLTNTGFAKLIAVSKNVITFFSNLVNVVTRTVRQLSLLNTILLSASGAIITGSALGIITQSLRDISTIISGGFKATFISVFNLFGKTFASTAKIGITAFTKAWKTLFKLDIVRGLYNIFRATGSIIKSFFIAANTVRRFIFSFGGILTIAELLLIFGPRIEFIRKAFERLGKGITDSFKTVFSIFTNLDPVLITFKQGIKDLFAGDTDAGITRFLTGFTQLSDLIGNKLAIAWNQFAIAIAPVYDFMRRMIASTIELASLFAGLFGQTLGKGLGNISEAISAGIGGGQGLSGLVRDIFTDANFKGIFEAVGAFFTGIAATISSTIDAMANAVITTMVGVLRAIATALQVVGAIGARFGLDDESKPTVIDLRTSAFVIEKTFGRLFKNNPLEPNKLQNLFQQFTDRLTQIFSVDTEAKLNLQNKINQQNEMDRDIRDQQNTDAILKQEQTAKKNAVRGNFGQNVPLIPGSLGKNIPELTAVQKAQNRVEAAQKAIFDNRINFFPPPKGTVRAGNSAERARALELKAAQQELQSAKRAERNQLRGIIPIEERRALLRDASQAAAQARRDAFKNRTPLAFANQRASLADVAATSVGTFQQTIGNMFGAGATQSIERQSLNTLQDIAASTEGSNTALQTILTQGQPLVFQ